MTRCKRNAIKTLSYFQIHFTSTRQGGTCSEKSVIVLEQTAQVAYHRRMN